MEGQQSQSVQLSMQRSQYLAVYLSLVHLLAFVTIVLTGIAWLSVIALAVLPLSLIWYLRRFYFSADETQLRLLAGQNWQLLRGGSLIADKLLLKRSYQSRFLLILYFKDSDRRRNINLLIPCDAVDEADYRLLRRRLRDSKIYLD